MSTHALRIRRDDIVQIMAGKDRGKRGKVIRVTPARRRVYVEGLNLIKRHERPRSAAEQSAATVGGVVEKEGPIHVSNVMLIDPSDDRPTRVGVRRDTGRPIRYSKRTGENLD
jgi:large subunit ribosomal protein L24